MLTIVNIIIIIFVYHFLFYHILFSGNALASIDHALIEHMIMLSFIQVLLNHSSIIRKLNLVLCRKPLLSAAVQI